jgi:hypothetical protein
MACHWFYANEKLSRAIYLLAVLPGDVRSRLLHAFMEFHPLKEVDFPPRLQKHYRWVVKQLTKHGPIMDSEGKVHRGAAENTLRHMRNSTGAKIAERLVMLHESVEEAIRIETAG